MKPATFDIIIARPLDEVHAALNDVFGRERYLDHFLTDWKRASSNRSGVGAAVRVRIKGGGRHDKVVLRLITSTSRRIVEETKAGKKYRRRARGTYELKTRRDGSTRVRFTLEFLEGTRMDRIAWPIGRRRMLRGTRQGLERLKAKLEA